MNASYTYYQFTPNTTSATWDAADALVLTSAKDFSLSEVAAAAAPCSEQATADMGAPRRVGSIRRAQGHARRGKREACLGHASSIWFERARVMLSKPRDGLAGGIHASAGPAAAHAPALALTPRRLPPPPPPPPEPPGSATGPAATAWSPRCSRPTTVRHSPLLRT